MRERVRPVPTVTDGDQVTVAEAREKLLSSVDKGVVCPCCETFSKVYKRRIYGNQIAWLIWLVGQTKKNKAEGGLGWVRASEYPNGGGDYAKLQFWGLAELMPKDPADTARRTSGQWRSTPKGERFVRGEEEVHTHVVLFNNQVLGFSGDLVSVLSVLGQEFNYSSLMSLSGLV